jgi:hypothetical protein
MRDLDAFEIAYNNGRAAGLAEKEGLLNEEESRNFLREFLNKELLTWFSSSRASGLLETLTPTIANTIASKMVTHGVRVLKKI